MSECESESIRNVRVVDKRAMNVRIVDVNYTHSIILKYCYFFLSMLW